MPAPGALTPRSPERCSAPSTSAPVGSPSGPNSRTARNAPRPGIRPQPPDPNPSLNPLSAGRPPPPLRPNRSPLCRTQSNGLRARPPSCPARIPPPPALSSVSRTSSSNLVDILDSSPRFITPSSPLLPSFPVLLAFAPSSKLCCRFCDTPAKRPLPIPIFLQPPPTPPPPHPPGAPRRPTNPPAPWHPPGPTPPGWSPFFLGGAVFAGGGGGGGGYRGGPRRRTGPQPVGLSSTQR
jgi:hypothetical protein